MTQEPTVQPQIFDYYNFCVIQNYVFNEPAAVIENSCTYEENGVLYCASATEKGVYCYSYCLNNPLMYTDPSGQSYRDVFDDYGINGNGKVSLLRRTTDDFNRLIALDENGKETNKSITVSKGLSDFKGVAVNGILEQLESTGKRFIVNKIPTKAYAKGGESLKDELFKVFKFAADNSNVEWRITKFAEDNYKYYSLGANLKDPYHSLMPEDMGLLSTNVLGFIHSHWGVSTNRTSELYSMGWLESAKMISPNKITDASIKSTNEMMKTQLYQTYFPNSGNLWEVRSNKIPLYLRNVSNYKGLFW